MENVTLVQSDYDKWMINIETGAIIHTVQNGGQVNSVAYQPSDFDRLMCVLLKARNNWDTVRAAEVKQQLWRLEMER